MKVKKDLSKLNLTDNDLSNVKIIFVSQSLCPYYKLLWSKSKRLHAMEQIRSYVSNGTVKVKLEENSRPISIKHATDFDKHFPDIDLSPPS